MTDPSPEHSSSGAEKPIPSRAGEAWIVKTDPNSPADENFGVCRITATTYRGLWELGVIVQFQGLPHTGLLEAYEEGILLAEALPRAAAVLLSTADSLSVNPPADSGHPPSVPNPRQLSEHGESEEIQKGFRELADLCLAASPQGLGVQWWL